MQHRGVVASAEVAPDLRERGVGVLVREVADQVACRGDRCFARFRANIGGLELSAIANEIQNRVHVQHLARLIHQTRNDALRQFDVDAAGAVVAHRKRQHRVDHALQFADTVGNVFGDVLNDLFRKRNNVFAAQFVVQNVSAQLQIRSLNVDRDAPFQAGEQAFFNPLELRRRTVAGDDDFALERLGGG